MSPRQGVLHVIEATDIDLTYSLEEVHTLLNSLGWQGIRVLLDKFSVPERGQSEMSVPHCDANMYPAVRALRPV